MSSHIKFQKGELVSCGNQEDRKLGIIISDPFYSAAQGWRVKTYYDGAVHSKPVGSMEKVCDDVEVIKNPF